MTKQQLDDAIAGLLRAGATYTVITEQLGVGRCRIVRVRDQYGITLPPGRAKRTRSELDAVTPKVLDMLRVGATIEAIYRETHVSRNRIVELRKRHQVSVPKRTYPSRTFAQALALHTEPFGDGHLRWIGPSRGRTPVLYAEHGCHNARHVIFRRRYGCAPLGYVRTTCTAPGCIADDHLADDISYRNPAISQAAAITYLLSKGATDWQIACHLGASAQAINRIRTQLKDKDAAHAP
ncbi:hypothetical protein AB8A21_41175 [Streptomyces sp. BF23-18]|uniref:hypothetical protein n=1 Tax=Streptomyces sp. BF23-18 TaxID=3240282 RepID=UPI0034E563BB